MTQIARRRARAALPAALLVLAAIARSRGIAHAANYFVDADASLNSASAPVGGLTVLRFADNHAAYALTWFALTLLSLGAAWKVAVSWRHPHDVPSL